MQELYRKYRPKVFQDVLGQPEAVHMLEQLLKDHKLPHTLLLSGPSGCGKTTLARILKSKLNCADADFNELNCADFRGIDVVRDIRQRMGLAPLNGACRIWLIDEAHSLTKDAQTAFLKILEDTPAHCYFFLATTEPNKLLATVRTRGTEIKLSPLCAKDMHQLLSAILQREQGQQPSPQVIERLVEVADGCARKSLVLLHQIMAISDEQQQLDILQKSDTQRQAIDIARALINPRSKWPEVAKIVAQVQDDPEAVRRLILAYAATVLLAGGSLADRAYIILTTFEANFFDSGRAGLIRACREVFITK